MNAAAAHMMRLTTIKAAPIMSSKGDEPCDYSVDAVVMLCMDGS